MQMRAVFEIQHGSLFLTLFIKGVCHSLAFRTTAIYLTVRPIIPGLR